MTIIIPMAGLGLRFRDYGYQLPKPLLPLPVKPMIIEVINNLNIDAKYIFIAQKEHEASYGLSASIEKTGIDFEMILLDSITQGPASTVLKARDRIDDNELVIVNCDQITFDLNVELLRTYARIKGADGIVGGFINSSPKNSYMKLNDSGHIIELREKEVISNYATNGFHYWLNGESFLSSADEMIRMKDTTNGEYYIAPSYNYLLKRGFNILPYFFNMHFPVGTPLDYQHYLDIYENL